MRPSKNIEKLIKNINIETNAATDEAVLTDVVEAFEESKKKKSAFTQPSIWRIIMKRKITKLAAATVIVIALLLLFRDSQMTLYAQVIKALEKAQTIHVVHKTIRNGQWEKTLEIWYKNGVGEKRIEWSKNKETMLVNNGQYVWKYTSGNDFAIRDKSLSQEIGLPRELLEVKDYLKICERDSHGDMVIDGFQCDMYAATRRDSSHGSRIMYWIDSQKRLRRVEENALKNGEWIEDEFAEVEYDVEIDPKNFTPDFVTNIKILKADEKLNEYFSLDDAVFIREELGFIFAVHKVKRCKGDMPYVVCSLRPTEQTRRNVIYQGPTVWNYGSFTLGSSWKIVESSSGRGRYYQPVELAHIYHDGLEAKLTILVPKGSWSEQIDRCELEVRIVAIGKSKEMRTKKGLSCDEIFKPMAILPLPKEQIDLKQVLQEVYSAIEILEPFVGHSSLTLKSRPWTDEEMEEYIEKHPDSEEARRYRSGDKSIILYHGDWSKPSDISEDGWTKDRIEYLEEVENR